MRYVHTFLFRSIVNDIFIHSSLLFFMGGCRICRGRSRDDCSLHFLHPVVSLQLYRSAIVRVFSGNNKRARPNLLSNRASSFVLNFVLNPCFPCNTPPFRLIINGLLSYFSWTIMEEIWWNCAIKIIFASVLFVFSLSLRKKIRMFIENQIFIDDVWRNGFVPPNNIFFISRVY